MDTQGQGISAEEQIRITTSYEPREEDEGEPEPVGAEQGELLRRLTYLREILAHGTAGSNPQEAASCKARLLAEIARVESRLGRSA